MKLTKPSRNVHPNILLYGPPKTGKTAGACSLPGEVGLLNCDLPNATWYAHSVHGERVSEIVPEGLDTLIEIVTDLKSGTLTQMDSLVVDPIGELHRRLLEEASNRAMRPTLNQYGDVSTHIERFCRALCEYPVNVCFVCHEYPVKDEASGQVEKLPWTGTTNPALGQKLMGMVDIVGYTGVVERENGTHEYIAQLITQGGRRGGERFGGVLGDWSPLNLADWIETITADPELEKAA